MAGLYSKGLTIYCSKRGIGRRHANRKINELHCPSSHLSGQLGMFLARQPQIQTGKQLHIKENADFFPPYGPTDALSHG